LISLDRRLTGMPDYWGTCQWCKKVILKSDGLLHEEE